MEAISTIKKDALIAALITQCYKKTIILLGLVADMVFTEIHDRCIHEKRMLLATVI